MRTLLLVPACCAILAVRSQDTCSCTHVLDRFIGKVERNYAGYQDKVATATRDGYEALKDSLIGLAAGTEDKSRCFHLLDRYRAYFRDKHLQLAGAYAHAEDGTDPAPPRTSAWTAATLDQRFTIHREELRTLEGLWSLDAYRVGLVYNDSLRAYDAIIAASQNPNWKEGMVKFTVTEPVEGQAHVHYWRGDLKTMETVAVFASGHLAVKGVGTWHMVQAPAGSMGALDFELNYGEEVQWRMLDDSTLYIKLGSFDLRNKALLDSLVHANKALLDRTPYWIVDLRGNGGGSTDVFAALLPYLYTRPMEDFGADHWMSPENTALLKAWAEANAPMLPTRTTRYLRNLVKYGERHPNTWFREKGGTEQHDKVMPMPERVAILADHGTASSGESFLFVARGMSGKSLIFGENSGGYMDYGDLQSHFLGCDGLVTSIPTARMNRIDHGMRFDIDGIAPDERIGKEVQDWIAVVRIHWAAHPVRRAARGGERPVPVH